VKKKGSSCGTSRDGQISTPFWQKAEAIAIPSHESWDYEKESEGLNARYLAECEGRAL
jgi:hypothetical protein